MEQPTAKRVKAALGLVRLRKADVADALPAELCFTSILVSDKHRLFDVLFFWND